MTSRNQKPHERPHASHPGTSDRIGVGYGDLRRPERYLGPGRYARVFPRRPRGRTRSSSPDCGGPGRIPRRAPEPNGTRISWRRAEG